MTIFNTWSNWVSNLGQATGDFTQQMSSAIIGQTCKISAKYPVLLSLNPFSRGLLKSYCQLTDDPPTFPVNPGFTGGQCPGVSYNCYGYYISNNIEVDGCGTVVTWTSGQIDGPVVGVNLPAGIPQSAAVIGNQSLDWAQCRSDNTGTLIQYRGDPCGFANVSAPTVFNNESVIITHCLRVDGLPDDCGDPPLTYPPDPPVEPADFNISVPIEIYNTNNELVEIENIPVTFNVDNSKPLNIDIDMGGINLTIGAPGLETVDAPPAPEDPDTKVPFNINNYDLFFFGNEDPQPGDEPLEQEEEEVEDETINWVLVEIVQTPGQGKSIIFPNPDNNTYFAGYFSWTIATPSGTFRLAEIPIRKKRTAFKAPAQALGYKFYAVNGATLRAFIYKQKVETE